MTTNSKIYTISISKLRPFENHPYKVHDNAEMDELAESVRVNGVITPLVIHPIGNDMYEVISGHRRLHAAQKAGLLSVPAVIYTMTKEEAAIALVDSNLHREHILPSEKAIAYKLKMESIKHQGKTSRQVVGKLESADKINPNESGRQIQRYIRLTYLIPEILQYVDDGKIAFTPAVELSYLTKQKQFDLLETIQSEDCTPSLSQAQRMKKLSQSGKLTMDLILTIMTEQKANQKEMFKVPMERIRKFAPKASEKQLEDFVLKACEYYYKLLLRKKGQER